MARRRKEYPPEQRRFGAHMSIAGGLHLAIERAVEAGCDLLQVFVKNQRQWHAPPLTDEAVRLWRDALAESNLRSVTAHDSYLINLAAPADDAWMRSIDALVDELERCEALGIPGLVAHPGAHTGSGERAGIRRIARGLDKIHRRTRGFAVKVLLEVTAGQGTNLGHRFEQLAEMIDRTRASERLGVCVDTCHLFAAGYDLTSAAGYEETITTLDAQVGLDRVACIHVNDSKRPLGSRVDRHEAIGQGEMKTPPFRRIINDPRLLGKPMILETPKGTDDQGRDLDRLNLARLRRLVRRSA